MTHYLTHWAEKSWFLDFPFGFLMTIICQPLASSSAAAQTAGSDHAYHVRRSDRTCGWRRGVCRTWTAAAPWIYRLFLSSYFSATGRNCSLHFAFILTSRYSYHCQELNCRRRLPPSSCTGWCWSAWCCRWWSFSRSLPSYDAVFVLNWAFLVLQLPSSKIQ